MDFDDPQVINDSRVFDDLKVHIAFDNPKAFCDKSMVSMVLLYKSQRLLPLYIYQSFVEMKSRWLLYNKIIGLVEFVRKIGWISFWSSLD